MDRVTVNAEALRDLRRWDMATGVQRVQSLCAALPTCGDRDALRASAAALPRHVEGLPAEVSLALAELALELAPYEPTLPDDVSALAPHLQVAWHRAGLASGSTETLAEIGDEAGASHQEDDVGGEGEGHAQAHPEVEVRDLARAERIDYLLAVGGGSVLDGSKFVAAAVPFEGDTWSILEKRGSNITRALPMGAVLTRLAELDPRRARVVELRFFGGLTNEEIARETGSSVATVERDWRAARAWLHTQLAAPADEEGP